MHCCRLVGNGGSEGFTIAHKGHRCGGGRQITGHNSTEGCHHACLHQLGLRYFSFPLHASRCGKECACICAAGQGSVACPVLEDPLFAIYKSKHLSERWGPINHVQAFESGLSAAQVNELAAPVVSGAEWML